MSKSAIKGWCPTAWQPMQAKDGWIMRLRPSFAAIRVQQWRTLAQLSQRYGDGQIELTRLGNVQLRGVSQHNVSLVLASLIDMSLVPADADVDQAPPVHCTPFYRHQDATHTLAQPTLAQVQKRLRPCALQMQNLQALPSKFGLLVDDPQRSLRGIGADIHLWVTGDGRYGLSAANALTWTPFDKPQSAVNQAIDLALWFARERMQIAAPPTRLNRIIAAYGRSTDVYEERYQAPARIASPQPGGHAGAGWLIGAPLGRLDAVALLEAIRSLPAEAELRVTPWHSLWLPTCAATHPFQDSRYWIFQADDTRLRVSGCTGAPRCERAHLDAQQLALAIAPHVPPDEHVHVSGCAKHCALPPQASLLIDAQALDPAPLRLGSTHSGQGDTSTLIAPQVLWTQPQQIQEFIHDLHLRNQR